MGFLWWVVGDGEVEQGFEGWFGGWLIGEVVGVFVFGFFVGGVPGPAGRGRRLGFEEVVLDQVRVAGLGVGWDFQFLDQLDDLEHEFEPLGRGDSLEVGEMDGVFEIDELLAEDFKAAGLGEREGFLEVFQLDGAEGGELGTVLFGPVDEGVFGDVHFGGDLVVGFTLGAVGKEPFVVGEVVGHGLGLSI